MTSSENVAIGSQALRGSVTINNNIGQGNVAVGYQSLLSLSSGNYNTAIGWFAGNSLTSGTGNVIVGGGSQLLGSFNTLIGYTAGGSITSGDKNTIIGKYLGSSTLNSTVVLADGDSNVYLYATSSRVAINKVANPNATLDVNGNTIITGSLTVTGPIRNIVNDGFVSCSLSTSGTGADRTILATFNEVDGTALTNPRQLVHWWTSTSQFGEAARTFGSPTTVTPVYSVTTGSNVTPIASTSGSINHAVTNTSGQLGLRLTTANNAGSATVWFHTEVQGIIYSISTTIFNQVD
jgi:hypothetical protein